MHSYILVVRYPSWLGWAGFLSMALFRLPLSLRKNISFFKLMGCGRNGGFDAVPDLNQWAILVVVNDPGKPNANTIEPAHVFGDFIGTWLKAFKAKWWLVKLQAIEGHGLWDGKHVFGQLPRNSSYEGPIAVLTRATIRVSQVRSFWKNVKHAAAPLPTTAGFIQSIGIGEVPWVKQATFSTWQNKQSMIDYAYKHINHHEVIKKTRKEDWYSEEMFVRFKILGSAGNLPANDLLQPVVAMEAGKAGK